MANESPVAGDRRPVKSRFWRISQQSADWLVKRSVSPNLISVCGMLAGVAGGIALAATSTVPVWERWLWLTGAVAIQLRLQANLLDGMVAVQSGKTSRLGELFNEVPDRVSDTALLVGASYAKGGDPLLGLWAALAAMFTAYVRTTGKTAGAPMEFCGPMAKQHRMAVLTVVCLAYSAGLAEWLGRRQPGIAIASLALWVILIGSVMTAVRRLVRIAACLRECQE